MAQRRIRLTRCVAPAVVLAALTGCAGGPLEGGVSAGRVAIPEEPPAGQAPGEPAAAGGALSSASQSLLEQSRVQRRAGQHELAAATIERAIRIDPQHPLPWLELGRLRLAEGRYDQAESLARKALALAGRDRAAENAARQLLDEAATAAR